jgi:pimeloyl-ACP methyl ester carboxylesterase
LAGAPYQVVLPAHWNGTLLIYSHGYREPGGDSANRVAEPALGWATDPQIGQELLAQGYALAGSAYTADGWAVVEGVSADEELYRSFRDDIGTPQRVYVWGDSLGGLISVMLAERHPDVVTGAVSLCGVLAGAVPNLDVALDVEYAVKTLLWPGLRLTGFTDVAEAQQYLDEATRQLDAAAATPVGAAKLQLIADLVDAPSKTRRFDGGDPASRVAASVESVNTLLGVGTTIRADVERRVGGNPSTNVGIDYTSRVSSAEHADIDLLSGGRTDQFLAALAGGTRVRADPAARAQALAVDGPTGRLAVPLVSIHTLYDPLVLSQNESWYAAAVGRSGGARMLRRNVTVPPATYPVDPGAPYGAGHCNFTPQTVTGAIDLLDQWVRSRTTPDSTAAATAFGPGSGLDPTAATAPWPAGRTVDG